MPFRKKLALLLRRSKELWRRYRQNKAAVIGLIIVSFFVFIACFAPQIAPYDPFKLGEKSFLPPSESHLMGTDDLGRDIFSGVVYGTQISMTVSVVAAGTSTIIGILFGMIAGYYGGAVDDLLMRITEIFQVIPRILLAIVIVALFGSNIWFLILVISILSWPSTARLVRADFASLKEREFVEASRALGIGDFTIVFGEILPNAIHSAVINGSLQVAAAILLEASLSFLGLGDPNVISWGKMLNNAQQFYYQAWWMAFFPGLSIFLMVLSANLIGDGINDVLNPRLKER